MHTPVNVIPLAVSLGPVQDRGIWWGTWMGAIRDWRTKPRGEITRYEHPCRMADGGGLGSGMERGKRGPRLRGSGPIIPCSRLARRLDRRPGLAQPRCSVRGCGRGNDVSDRLDRLDRLDFRDGWSRCSSEDSMMFTPGGRRVRVRPCHILQSNPTPTEHCSPQPCSVASPRREHFSISPPIRVRAPLNKQSTHIGNLVPTPSISRGHFPVVSGHH